MLCNPDWIFGLLPGYRRHHCRSCGWVVCATCLHDETLELDRWVSSTVGNTLKHGNPTKPKRVCNSCAEHAPTEIAARLHELQSEPELQLESEPEPEPAEALQRRQQAAQQRVAADPQTQPAEAHQRRQQAAQRRVAADPEIRSSPHYCGPLYWSASDHVLGSFAAEVTDREALDRLRAIMIPRNPKWLSRPSGWAQATSTPSIEMCKAWRLQNVQLWRRYAAGVGRVADDMARYHAGDKLPAFDLNLAPALQKGTDEGFNSARQGQAFEDVNEIFLLHGIQKHGLLKAMKNGLHPLFSQSGGRAVFGDGVYLSEYIEKADQYVGEVDHAYGAEEWSSELHRELYKSSVDHPGDVCYVLVCRVAMGYTIRTQYRRSQKPGDVQCVALDGTAASSTGCVFASDSARELAPLPGTEDQPICYHSLLVETGGAVLRFREFVVFHGDYIYPEFVVAYKRKVHRTEVGPQSIVPEPKSEPEPELEPTHVQDAVAPANLQELKPEPVHARAVVEVGQRKARRIPESVPPRREPQGEEQTDVAATPDVLEVAHQIPGKHRKAEQQAQVAEVGEMVDWSEADLADWMAHVLNLSADDKDKVLDELKADEIDGRELTDMKGSRLKNILCRAGRPTPEADCKSLLQKRGALIGANSPSRGSPRSPRWPEVLAKSSTEWGFAAFQSQLEDWHGTSLP